MDKTQTVFKQACTAGHHLRPSDMALLMIALEKAGQAPDRSWQPDVLAFYHGLQQAILVKCGIEGAADYLASARALLNCPRQG